MFGLSASMAFGETGLGTPVLVPGPATCSTSGCHGGAGEKSRQYVIWSQRDVHSRAYATLTSSRAARMAESLLIDNPTRNPSCTACHAPMQTVAAELLAPDAHVEDGIACASCHGTGEGWLRSHTRTDWTHADRVAAGMPELRNLYERANRCVACHQNIDPKLVTVGRHPALLFELDGQTVSQPKHWRELTPVNGAQAWFVGQAVALREMSWALQEQRADPATDLPCWAGLSWVLARCELGAPLPAPDQPAGLPAYTATLEASDLAARQAAGLAWTHDLTKSLLGKLAATNPAFLDHSPSVPEQARRAERLVLGLDRLLASLPANQRPAAASAALDRLFRLAQSPADFKPADFARELAAFETAVN